MRTKSFKLKVLAIMLILSASIYATVYSVNWVYHLLTTLALLCIIVLLTASPEQR